MSQHVEWINPAAHSPEPTCVVQGTEMPDGFQVDMPFALVLHSDIDRMVAIEGTAQQLMGLLEEMRVALGRTVTLSETSG